MRVVTKRAADSVASRFAETQWRLNGFGKSAYFEVFEHDDTIRTEFYASAYSASVGQFAHPVADKIGGRLAEEKLE